MTSETALQTWAGDEDARPGARFGWWLVTGAILIGAGVRVRGGTLTPVALGLVLAAFAIVALRPWDRPWGHRGRNIALGLGLAQLILFGADVVAATWWDGTTIAVRVAVVVLLLVELAIATAILLSPPSRSWWTVLFLGVHLALAVTVVMVRMPMAIDVLVFHEGAAEAVAAGENPFAITFPDIYPSPESGAFYGPGISVEGVLQFGYPYPPLNLPFVVFGSTVGDVRVMFVVASVMAAGVVWRIGVARFGAVAAVLFLTSPSFLRVTSLGWTEPLIVLALATAVLVAVRRPPLTPWLLGIVIGLKQYMILFAPLYLLFLGPGINQRRWLRDVLIALAVPAMTVMPFLALNAEAFLWSVVELQFHQPYRPESLSVLAAIHNATGWPPESMFGLLPFLAAAVAWAVVLRRGDHSLRGLTYGIVVVSLSFLLVSKQAFANYYFFTIGAAFVAAAAAHLDRPPAHLVNSDSSSTRKRIA